ncbi:MAG: xanthine dehydrogenase family protein molybdopterin-binding subunit [Deltaproteobacteria bacterium]|nr:xanthine dehydrogenase family protein molybdopterin-binding subunit [Deltaproteobacteria bacterium]MDZ4341010.1 xanthine dehydrogenase family protein molybdopterin-binding subunit [Candidatus Binatia bacterium]
MMQVVGKPTPRVEGELKVTGKAQYSADLKLPNMLWGRCLRSPISSGRIKSIDISKALRAPGVKAVITGKDVPGLRIGRRICDTPVVADGVVRFIGEKVAAVAAETKLAAEQALDLIEVEYEELEPLLDPLEAIKPGAPILHPDLLSYRGLPVPVERLGNIFSSIKWGKGDIEAGFREADLIVENTYTTQVTHQSYLEPHACVVKADPSGGAEVWSCSKTPFAVRTQLSNCIGIAREKLVFYPMHVGGDFGGKGGFMDVPAAYFLSLKSGQPVKMIMDYTEELTAGNPRHASIIKIKTGVKKNGAIVAHHLDFIFDSGAYGSMKPGGYLIGASTCAGPYRIANCLIEERMVYTNKIPCGHMRAPGDPQGFFANESQLDIVARKLGMDPAEFKRKNMLRDGDETPIGLHISHIRGAAALDKAIQLSGYGKPKPKHVGRGLSFSEWSPNGGEGNVFVIIDKAGDVKVSSPVVDQGAGVFTVIVECVGEELKVAADRIELTQLDSTMVPSDGGVGGSRATRVYGNASCDAGSKARAELFAVAARKLGVEVKELELANSSVVHKKSRRKLSFAEVVRINGSPISAKGYYKSSEKSHDASVSAQIAEVHVDPETGQVTLRNMVSAHSTGKVINPLMHQGQVEGGVVMGLGFALTEEVMFDGGKITTTNFGEFKIPNITDIPPLKTAVMENVPAGPGPYNSLAIGEVANVPTAAAVANAVADACGVRITDLPVTSEKVYRALRARSAS